MKSIAIMIMWVGVAVISSSCNKIKDAIFPTIDIDLPAFQFTVPAIPIVLENEASLGSFSMHFNLDSLIRANTAGAFGAGAVSTVKVKNMQITVNDADQNNNLANFESVRFVLTTNGKPTPAEIIATTFPDNFSTSAIITPESTPELKDYLKDNLLTYTLYGKARRTTSKPLSFTVKVVVSAH